MKIAAVLLALVSTTFAQDLKKATKHLAAGRLEEASREAAGVSERSADFAKSRYLVGEIALLRDDASGAKEAFEAARTAKPKSGPILVGLGRAQLALEEHDAAAATLAEAVKAVPRSGRAHCLLGVALARSSGDGGGAKAAKAVARGLKLAGGDPVVAREGVLFWLDREDQKRARRAAYRFRKKQRKHPMGPFLRALVLEREKEYDDAIEAYQRAIALDGKFLDAHKNLAILCIAQNPMYQDAKRTRLALKHFDRYRELGGKDQRLIRIHETLKQFIKRAGR